VNLVPSFERHWATGTLISVGDELANHKYFDHAPELELVYHLRNGVAHGNVFTFTRHGLERLAKHPANNEFSWGRGDATVLSITPGLKGKSVVPDFLGPGDAIEILTSAGLYLHRYGNGDTLRPDGTVTQASEQ
jgi:hypothetical protein